MVALPRIEVSPVDYGSEEAAMAQYRADGERRAMALGNRGPIRFDANGKLDPAILAGLFALRLLRLRRCA